MPSVWLNAPQDSLIIQERVSLVNQIVHPVT
jgi:hypothetical protein